MEDYIDEILRRLDTHDVFAIAGKACVPIVYESWHPASVGEFEKKSKTIRVNRRALVGAENAEDLEKKIVAHELGHFYAIDLKLGKNEEEKFARLFAGKLLERNESKTDR